MKNQEKISPKLKLLSLLIASCLILIFPACDDPTTEILNFNSFNPTKPEVSFVAGPEGGTFHAINRNVTMIIPQGSIDEQVKFLIKEGPVDNDGDFVIKSIEISPKSVFFKIPVTLSLKYNGRLSCGSNPCNAKCLIIYQFRNEAAFEKRNFGERNLSNFEWTEKCTLNRNDCCIETEIISGGVFAIGEESLAKTNN
jgi:hypothetical protein